MEAGRGVLEERQVRDHEAVARAPEEDPDEGQDQPEGARLGEFIKPNWQNTHAAFVKLGTLKGSEAATDSFTEQFLAACNDFDRTAVVALAKSMDQ